MKFDRLDAADCIRHKLRALGFGRIRIVYRQHVFPLKLNLHLLRLDKPGNRSTTRARCAQDTQVYPGTLYYRNKCCCGVSAQDCECSKSLRPERTEVQYIQRCQGWRMEALRGSTQRLCDKAPEPPRKRGQGTQRRCRDDSGRARRAWNCSMQSVKNAAMARSVPHAIEILLLRH